MKKIKNENCGRGLTRGRFFVVSAGGALTAAFLAAAFLLHKKSRPLLCNLTKTPKNEFLRKRA